MGKLEEMTVDQLRDVADGLEIDVSGLKKAEIIDAIKAARDEDSKDESNPESKDTVQTTNAKPIPKKTIITSKDV